MVSLGQQLLFLVHTGQGEDFISDVDCCIMLALVQCFLSPTSQIFVHAATSEWSRAGSSSGVPKAFLESGAIAKAGCLSFE
jgi:hypothetical protein